MTSEDIRTINIAEDIMRERCPTVRLYGRLHRSGGMKKAPPKSTHSDSRERGVFFAAVYLSTRASFPELKKRFEMTDHTTIVRSVCRACADGIADVRDFMEKINEIRRLPTGHDGSGPRSEQVPAPAGVLPVPQVQTG